MFSMGTPHKIHSRIIPVDIDNVQLAKRRRELAIRRYELIQNGSFPWKPAEAIETGPEQPWDDKSIDDQI